MLHIADLYTACGSPRRGCIQLFLCLKYLSGPEKDAEVSESGNSLSGVEKPRNHHQQAWGICVQGQG